MTVPVITVVIPTYNRPEMLARALNSLVRQSFESFDVVVVDDASSLNIASIVCCYEDRLNIQVIRNKRNCGAAVSRNRGIDQACGQLVAFLDDDDEYLPHFLAHCWHSLSESADNIGFCWSGVINRHYRADKPVRDSIRLIPEHLSLPTADNLLLFQEVLSVGTGFGVAVKAPLIRQLGGFNEALETVEDTEFFTRLIAAGYKPLPLTGANLILHHHDAMRMTSVDKHQTRIGEINWLLTRYPEFYHQFPSLREQLMNHIQTLYHELGSVASSSSLPSSPLAAGLDF